ncbi:MAG TPA: hypothetical protein VIA98_06700 [Allosphingosinicella sp.]|jgi:hypothetical protein
MKSVILLGFAAIVATQSAAAADTASKSARDPNRTVCRTEQVVGSRLAKVKRCMTAAEWAEIKRLDRQALEKSQNRGQRAE